MPKLPGCYQYFDNSGEIIYIGKAKNLYNRVNSYFMGNKKDSPKLQVMVPQIERVECIVVNSEIEALILENELIKKHKPKYNILLKDDKKFPYFLITKEDYPRILVVRKTNQNKLKGKYIRFIYAFDDSVFELTKNTKFFEETVFWSLKKVFSFFLTFLLL